MPYTIKLIDPLEDPRWDKFVDEHPLGSIYHLSGWKRVIESSFKHISGSVIVLCNRSGQIEAGLPIYFVKSWLTGNRIVSAPFALYCSPLTSSPEDIHLLFEYVKNISAEWDSRYLEIRMMPREDLYLYQGDGFGVSRYNKTHHLEIKGTIKDLQKSFCRDVRYSIKRAYKNQLVAQTVADIAGLKKFYEILCENRKYLGLPIIPFRFFEELWNVFHDKGYIRLLLALKNEKVIGGHLFLQYKGSILSEYKCSLLNFRRLRVSHFLEWEAIKHAHLNGFKVYSFGRTGIDNKGLLYYKERWGTKVLDIPRLYLPASFSCIESQKHSSRHYKFARMIFGHAPVPVLKILGKLIYMHMG